MSDELLDSAVKFGSGGGGFAAVLLAGRWLINWATGRHDRREARLDAKDDAIDHRWSAYTRRIEDRCGKLEERCDAQEREIEACHKDKREMAERLTALEGFAKGLGDRRQEEQLIRALESRLENIEQKGTSA